MITVFLNTIFPLFAIIIFGFILKQKKVITEEWEKISNKIVYNIAVPAILIKALSKSQINEVFSFQIISSIVIPIIVTIFIAFIIGTYF
jgi:predicted permease